jgi:hypothetical protein
MPTLPRLADKLDLFYGCSPEIQSDKQLAAALGYSALATITQMKNGRLDRGYAPGEVTCATLERLAELLVSARPLLGLDAAKALWLAEFDDFEHVLRQRPRKSLSGVLEATPRQLDVTVHVPGDGLGAIEDAYEVPSHAQVIRRGEQYALKISGAGAGALLVLCESTTGWQIVAPGKLHTGEFDGDETRLPSEPEKWLSFRATHGQHRFYVITHPPGIASWLPAAGTLAPVAEDVISSFAGSLTASRWAGKWKWGDAFLLVESPSSAPAEPPLDPRNL